MDIRLDNTEVKWDHDNYYGRTGKRLKFYVRRPVSGSFFSHAIKDARGGGPPKHQLLKEDVMKSLVEEFLGKKRFAVVGSFRNETKYAYRILRDLASKGYEVYPVNPNTDKVDGMVCYKSILDIPFDVDVADIVTPPHVTVEILRECLQKGIGMVWLQPGAESEEAIRFCREKNIKCLHSICVMTESIGKGQT